MYSLIENMILIGYDVIMYFFIFGGRGGAGT